MLHEHTYRVSIYEAYQDRNEPPKYEGEFTIESPRNFVHREEMDEQIQLIKEDFIDQYFDVVVDYIGEDEW